MDPKYDGSLDQMKLKGKAHRSDDLDDDVCMEILLRLPVKSIIRFKLIRKWWLSLISAHHFHHLHNLPPHDGVLSHHRLHNSKFLYFNPISDIDTANPTKMIPFTINRPKYYPNILSSCNGLLLLYNYCTNYEDLHVYNLATKQSRELSLAHNDEKSTRVVQLHLVFDPSVSIHYKVVCIWAGLKLDMQTYKMQIFDSEGGTWNIRTEPFTYTHIYGNIVAYNILDKSYSELLGDQRSHLSFDYFHEFFHTSSHIHQFAETLALL